MSQSKQALSGFERRFWQLLGEVGRQSGHETIGEYHAFSSYHQFHRSAWGTWVFGTRPAEQFAVLSEPRLRADRLILSLWRSAREAEEVRQLRVELAQARRMLNRLVQSEAEPCSKDEVDLAVGTVATVAGRVFGPDKINQLEVTEESDPDIAARHRITVGVTVGGALSLEALAEARAEFFRSVASELPKGLPGKVRVVLQLSP